MSIGSLPLSAMPRRGGSTAVSRLTRWLSLASTPVFAVMAVLAGTQGGMSADMPGMSMPDPSPLTGMATMYVLMSLFHVTPWLKLVSRLPHRRPHRTTLDTL